MMMPERTIITVALATLCGASYLLVFFAGIIVGFFGVILLGRITSWIGSKKRAKYKEFKLGDDLFDVEIPDFMPKDKDTQD